MSTPRTVAFHTLGCKLNYSETSALARLFESNGYLPVKFEESADIYVLNTCSVTEQADRECRKIVRQAMRRSPEAWDRPASDMSIGELLSKREGAQILVEQRRALGHELGGARHQAVGPGGVKVFGYALPVTQIGHGQTMLDCHTQSASQTS